MPDDLELFRALASLRERGALGEASLPDAVRHAEAFLEALPPLTRRVIDLGSGGGLPGLVLAVRRPNIAFVLTDRRERRTDLLRMACIQLGLADRVSVVTGDVARLALDPQHAGHFDAVTARAFGEPAVTARAAVPFLAPTGVVIVSEPPALALLGEDEPRVAIRWPAAVLTAIGLRLSRERFDLVRRLERAVEPGVLGR